MLVTLLTALAGQLGGGVASAAGPAASTRTAAGSGSGGGDRVPVALKLARVQADRATLNVVTLQVENLNAEVTDAETGQPLAGKEVKFYLGDGKLLGTAFTNSQGTASRNAYLDVGLSTVHSLAGGGYYADLLGDGTYRPAQGHGTLTVGTSA